MAYLNVVKVNDALKQMQARFPQQDADMEMVDLHSSLGRYLTKDLYANESLPSFRRSMVDGYAILSADSLGASEQSPMVLRKMGTVDMSKKAEFRVVSGCAAYVPTGGEIPEGADAMIMIEHTEVIGNDIAIYSTATYGENIVDVGEDVLEQTLILKKGTRLAPQHGAILASLGYAMIPVVKKLRVAILSTGDELVEVSSKPSYGQVRDCNATIIRNVVEACGCEVVIASRVIDRLDELQKSLKWAVESADVILLSGGSSAGDKDMTQMVIDSLPGNEGTPNVFIHGLAIKPGKPTIVGQVEKKAVIGLPGHPAACFITMKALVEPFLDYLVNKTENAVKSIPCISGFQLHAASGRDVYQMVELVYENGLLTAHILHGKSGMVSAIAKANAYVVIPAQHEGVRIGDMLTAYLL